MEKEKKGEKIQTQKQLHVIVYESVLKTLPQTNVTFAENE